MMTEQEHNNVQWRKVKLGEVGEIISGGTPSTTNETFWDGDVLFVTPLDLGRKNKIDSTLRTISELGVKNSSANRIKAHSLAISTRAPIGLMSIVNQDFTTNQGCKSIQFYDSYDSEFFYYYLSYNVEKIQRYGQGTTFMEISKTDFSNLEFTVPDLAAQRRIASILASADKVIAATQKLIAKYKQMKQGMMEELFNEQCTMNNVQWRKVRLGEVGDFYVGGDVDRSCFSPYPTVECRFPIYANALVNEGLYGYSSKYEFDKEAVTITGRGDVGKVFYRKPYFTTIIRLVTLIPTDSNIDVKFLSYAMSKINFIIESTGVPQLTAPQAKKYEVSVPYKNDKPDLTEQHRIASILSGIDAKIAAEEKVLEKYEKVKKGLMERMLDENDN